MDNNETLFETEKAFSVFNKYIAVLTAVYYVIIALFGKSNSSTEIIIGGAVALTLALDWLAGSKEYFHSKILLRVVRYMILFTSAFAMIYNGGIYITIAAMSMIHISIIFEHLFMYDIAEDYYKISAVLDTLFPITLVTLVYYFFTSDTNFEIIVSVAFIAIIVFCLVGNMKVCGDLLNKLLNNMYRQERIAINSKEEYENLKVYQSKLVRANEQLSIQRFQLQKLNESVNSKNRQMDLQYKILRHISGALEIEKLTEFITSGIITNLNVEICGINIFDIDMGDDEPRDFCKLSHAEDITLPDNAIQLFKEFTEKIDLMHMQDEYMIIDDVVESEYPFLKGVNISSFLIYIISISDTQKGFLFVGRKRSGYFTESNIGFYKSIGEQISVAVNNAAMYTKMQDMATKDPLTKIFNRRHFNSIYPKFIEKAGLNKEPLTVILFDIDKFKNVNDQYGHLFGDKVIHFCGSIAGKTASENGASAVRYGGEEFVIVFPGKGTEEVYEIVKNMHEQIKENPFDYEGSEVHINVSIGIASYPETCEDLDELLNRADLAMYHSKNTGRGRITIDSAKVRGEE